MNGHPVRSLPAEDVCGWLGPVTPPLIPVVGAVIVRDGHILCARRGTGPLAGLWEFPGGKVEPDETPQEALVREIEEELGCTIGVGDEVTTTTHAYDFATIALTTFWAELEAGDPEPESTDHDEVRWLAPAELSSIDWASADIPAIEMIHSTEERPHAEALSVLPAKLNTSVRNSPTEGDAQFRPTGRHRRGTS